MEHFKLRSRFYFSRLSAADQKVYREIYEGWYPGSCTACICMPGSGFETASGTSLHRIVEWIIYDNPHLFHLDTSQIRYTRHGDDVKIEADEVYSCDEYKRIYRKLVMRTEQILQLAGAHHTDYEKIKYIHDYLADNITYDLGMAEPRSAREVHTIVGALLNSACVCDGYARAFRLLCDRMHIPCIVAIGDSLTSEHPGAHAWNIVKCGGKYYHLDVTWDSNLQYPFYFLRGDDFFSLDHTWNRMLYSPMPGDHPGHEKALESAHEMERYICGRVRRGDRSVVLRLAATFPGEDAVMSLIERIVRRNPEVFLQIPAYTVQFYERINYLKLKL